MRGASAQLLGAVTVPARHDPVGVGVVTELRRWGFRLQLLQPIWLKWGHPTEMQVEIKAPPGHRHLGPQGKRRLRRRGVYFGSPSSGSAMDGWMDVDGRHAVMAP